MVSFLLVILQKIYELHLAKIRDIYPDHQILYNLLALITVFNGIFMTLLIRQIPPATFYLISM
jgi:hypothetical protein